MLSTVHCVASECSSGLMTSAVSIDIRVSIMITDLPGQGLAMGVMRNAGTGTAEREVTTDRGQSIQIEEE